MNFVSKEGPDSDSFGDSATSATNYWIESIYSRRSGWITDIKLAPKIYLPKSLKSCLINISVRITLH